MEPNGEPLWLRSGHFRIANRPEPLTTPFSNVSGPDIQTLDEAESTQGGLKRVLARVVGIAHQIAHSTYKKQAVDLFVEENEEESNEIQGGNGEDMLSLSLLECIWRAMVLEDRIREKDKAQVKEKGDKMIGGGSIMPP